MLVTSGMWLERLGVMRILVMGASGRLGSLVVREALEQGHAVTAAARTPQALELAHPALDRAPVDVRDRSAVLALVPGHDAVISTLGYRRHGEAPDVLLTGMRNLIRAMEAAGVRRLVALASAGILQLDDTRLRSERAGYPEAFRPGAEMHRQAWEALRASALDWTLVCPPELAAGPADQPLRVMPDHLPEGPLRVSMPALARWMLTELLAAGFSRQRVGVLDVPGGVD